MHAASLYGSCVCGNTSFRGTLRTHGVLLPYACASMSMRAPDIGMLTSCGTLACLPSAPDLQCQTALRPRHMNRCMGKSIVTSAEPCPLPGLHMNTTGTMPGHHIDHAESSLTSHLSSFLSSCRMISSPPSMRACHFRLTACLPVYAGGHRPTRVSESCHCEAGIVYTMPAIAPRVATAGTAVRPVGTPTSPTLLTRWRALASSNKCGRCACTHGHAFMC